MRGKVIVVGGGLSGLAAAYWLQQAGMQVQVLESALRPGGRALTIHRQGYVIDAGPDAATSAYREYLELMRAMGLQHRIVSSSPVVGIARQGRVHEIDPRKPFAALMTPALSWRAKLMMVIGLIKLRSQLRQVDPFDLVNCADLDNPAISGKQYARQIFGEEVTDYLLDPAIRLTTGSGAHRASLLSLPGTLRGWSGQLLNVKGGLDQLPKALANSVPVVYDATVTHVESSAVGVDVKYRSADGGAQQARADYCVIASMYHVARDIWLPLRELAPDFDQHLESVKLISISLGYAASCNSEAYAVMMPTAEFPDVLLMFLQQNKAPDRVQPGCSLVTLYTDTSATDRLLAHTDQALEAWAANIVESLLPELKGRRELCEVTRWPHAGYLATPGFWQRLVNLKREMAAYERIQLAGDLFGAGSMESAVRWGRRAAERIIHLDKACR